jgi:hypothetical protein
MPYAEGTEVSVERSKAELEGLLSKHGATQRGVLSDDDEGRAVVMFTLKSRQYRLNVPLPKFEAFARKYDRHGRWSPRNAEQQRVAFEQGCRERWRAVVLVIKAKLELVSLGVTTVEREFLADLVLPDGRRVHDALEEGIRTAYATGQMPPLLPPATGGQ